MNAINACLCTVQGATTLFHPKGLIFTLQTLASSAGGRGEPCLPGFSYTILIRVKGGTMPCFGLIFSVGPLEIFMPTLLITEVINLSNDALILEIYSFEMLQGMLLYNTVP